MKSPVFLNQNQKKFALPLSQPNSQPIKARVLTALPWVDHNSCGIEITEATTKKASHSRQRDQLISARHAPTPITTMKLCACTSGNKPATRPAASIRLVKGKRKKEKGKNYRQLILLLHSCSFPASISFPNALPFFPLPFFLFLLRCFA